LRQVGPVLDSFVSYHLAIGFDHLFLFFDDPRDPDLVRVHGHRSVTAIPCDTSLRKAWARLPRYPDHAPFIDTDVMTRQILNVVIAMRLARQQGYSWLLHIDADELFYSPRRSAAEHFAWLETLPFETVRYFNYEAANEREHITDCFREVELFKVPPNLNRGVPAEAVALLRRTPQLHPQFFNFYGIGKSAVRLSVDDIYPSSVHEFTCTNRQCAALESADTFVLHYACCGFEMFWTKYLVLGRFPDQWGGMHDIKTLIGPFHLEARDVVAKGDREAARAFYRRRMILDDARTVEALTSFGILTRIPLPRRILEGRAPNG
jgi:hypothetical protein